MVVQSLHVTASSAAPPQGVAVFSAPQPPCEPTGEVLQRGQVVRASQKSSDWLLVHFESGATGWLDASLVLPVQLPAFFQASEQVPEGATLRLRASADMDGAVLAAINDRIVYAVQEHGDWIRVLHKVAETGQLLDGWMLTATDTAVLLTPCVPTLAMVASGLPEGAQLRMRDIPSAQGTELAFVSATDPVIFQLVQQNGAWVRVLHESEPVTWMLTSAESTPLLNFIDAEAYCINPVILQQMGALQLRIRQTPDENGAVLGILDGSGTVDVIDRQGEWLRVLHSSSSEAWVLCHSNQLQDDLVVPVNSVGRDQVYSNASSYSAQSGPIAQDAFDDDGSEYMIAVHDHVKVRDEADFVGVELRSLKENDVVKVVARQDDYVKVSQGGLEDGWIKVKSRGGDIIVAAPDRMAAARQWEMQAQAVAASKRKRPGTAIDGPPEQPQQAVAATSNGTTTYTAPTAAPSALSADGSWYMKATGNLKVREEPDAQGFELGTVLREEYVNVLEAKDDWVRVSYSKEDGGLDSGWVLTATKRGRLLYDAEDPDAAGVCFANQQKKRSGVSAAGVDEQQVGGGGGGGGMKGQGADGGVMAPKRPSAAAAATVAFTPSAALGASGNAAQGVGGGGTGPSSGAKAFDGYVYMRAVGPVKVRDESEAWGMELMTVSAGEFVRVLETRDKWIRVGVGGIENGWALTKNKLNNLLEFAEDPDAAASAWSQQGQGQSENTPPPASFDDMPVGGSKGGGSGSDGGGGGAGGGRRGMPEGLSEQPMGRSNARAEQTTAAVDEGFIKGVKAMEGGNATVSARSVSSPPTDAALVDTPKPSDGVTASASGSSAFLVASGPLKMRDDNYPGAVELAVVPLKAVVKVLEWKDKWVRVSYRGRADGWILSENKKGKLLIEADNEEEAAATWASQKPLEVEEAPIIDDERPLGGLAKNAGALGAGMSEESAPVDGAVDVVLAPSPRAQKGAALNTGDVEESLVSPVIGSKTVSRTPAPGPSSSLKRASPTAAASRRGGGIEASRRAGLEMLNKELSCAVWNSSSMDPLHVSTGERNQWDEELDGMLLRASRYRRMDEARTMGRRRMSGGDAGGHARAATSGAVLKDFSSTLPLSLPSSLSATSLGASSSSGGDDHTGDSLAVTITEGIPPRSQPQASRASLVSPRIAYRSRSPSGGGGGVSGGVSSGGGAVSPSAREERILSEASLAEEERYQQLLDWLKAHDLEKYYDKLRGEEMDLALLKTVTSDELKDLGFPMGARKKMLQCIGELDALNTITSSTERAESDTDTGYFTAQGSVASRSVSPVPMREPEVTDRRRGSSGDENIPPRRPSASNLPRLSQSSPTSSPATPVSKSRRGSGIGSGIKRPESSSPS